MSAARIATSSATPTATIAGSDAGHVIWMTDLVRLEITLWNRVDARLQQEFALSLGFFECLQFVSFAKNGLRVSELADRIKVTVGGASKQVDRLEAAGLIKRGPDADDRRASLVKLTALGERALKLGTRACEAELASTLDPVLTFEEQQQMREYVTRLLTASPPVMSTGSH